MLIILWFISLANSEKGVSYGTMLQHMPAILPFPPKKRSITSMWSVRLKKIPVKWNIHEQNTIQAHLSKIFWDFNMFSLIRFWIITGEYFLSFLISALITVIPKSLILISFERLVFFKAIFQRKWSLCFF